MQEGRAYTAKRKSILILDRRFPIYSDLNVGDTGQAIVEGTIDSERIESLPDEGEDNIKTILINNIKSAVENKKSREL